jgi:DNA-binding CsgD family transcriptional regulator/PAS domain-containing protein
VTALPSTSIRLEPENLSRLIGLGYEATLSRTAWRQFADEMAAASGSQLAMIQYIDDERPDSSFLVCGGLGNEFEETFAQTSWLSDDDHFWTDIRSKPSGTVRLGHEIVPRQAMHKTNAYTRVAMPWKLEHFLISAITTGNGVSAFLSLGRSRKKAPYLDGDKALFSNMVLAHLRRSFTLHRDFEATRQSNAMLASVVDLTPYGLVVFNTRGRPVIVNRKATQIFGASEGLALIHGRLHAADSAAHARIESALSIALHGALGSVIAPPDPVMVPRTGSASPYQIVFSQLQLRDELDRFPAGSAVIAMIHDRWLSGPEYVPLVLRSTYGLTKAEIRLCQAMLAGKSLPEAATAMNISRNTAKSHLARIFDKTGVHTQAALLRLLATGRRRKITNP